ncbi:hypothetical protein ElyMa_002088200 [Elysia marginata]|uniref:Uncharacterized protein n=1 Tax=Elysia marginata TaxID=1093978 RepID=A0AAV4FFL3_9GAST|nr:hypothetical protein ElyMa_002088200 [Elysia marginata]
MIRSGRNMPTKRKFPILPVAAATNRAAETGFDGDRVDQTLEDGSGLLHLAALSQNTASVQYLVQARVSPRIRDRRGKYTIQYLLCATGPLSSGGRSP